MLNHAESVQEDVVIKWYGILSTHVIYTLYSIMQYSHSY